MATRTTLNDYLQALQRRGALTGPLKAWLADLETCLPGQLRHWFRADPPKLVLETDSGGLVISREFEGSQEAVGVYPLEEQGPPPALLAREHRGFPLILRLPAEQALETIITLPLAAEENLRQVLSYEMDRYTPFAAQEVYYGYQILERLAEEGKLRVRLVVLLRRTVDPWLEQLARWGQSPSVVTITGGSDTINVLPLEERPTVPNRLRKLNYALAGCVLLLAGLAVVVPLWQQRTLAIEMDSAMQKKKRQAEQVMALQRKLDQAVQASQFLIDKKRSTPSKLMILEELTQVLPDSTYVRTLRIRESSVAIHGLSAEASSLIQIMEDSPIFQNPNFSSPVTSLQQSDRDRFQLEAELASNSQQGTSQPGRSKGSSSDMVPIGFNREDRI